MTYVLDKLRDDIEGYVVYTTYSDFYTCGPRISP